MSTAASTTLKRTALNAVHKAAGAKMVEFGGWEMPVEYSSITQEHLAVRTRAGLFDVSHMGEIDVRGPQALALIQSITSNDASRLEIHQAQYSALMLPQGSAVDDCVVHRLEDDHYFICVNASNTDKDFDWMVKHNTMGADVRNVSSDYSQLAIQGPAAAGIVARVTDGDVVGIRYYRFRRARCCGVDGLLARTGYTGEDGFEFYFPPAESENVWGTLLDAGKSDGLIPAGLGARNTLRLEAAYPLYGHELDEATTLLKQREQGVHKKLIGFEMTDRAIGRDGYPVWIDARKAGQVTSGSPAPFLKKNIGLAYVPPADAQPGREIEIEIRGKMARARQVSLPFYKRPKA